MKRSRSRSPSNHPHPSKRNWHTGSHKWQTDNEGGRLNGNESRHSSRSSRRRNQADNDCINIQNHHSSERLQRSASCDASDGRSRRINNRRIWEENDEEMSRIRVVIKRNTVHQTDDTPINRMVNPEEVVIPRRAGEGCRPIFDREDITAETRTVEHWHQTPRDRPSTSRTEDHFHDRRRSEGRRFGERDHSKGYRDPVNSYDGDHQMRRVELEPRASSSRNYHEPSTSRNYHEPSFAKPSRDGSKEHERRKVCKKEDEELSSTWHERDSDHHSSRRTRHHHHTEKHDERSASPQPRSSSRRTPKKSEGENGHCEAAPSTSQETEHLEEHYGGDSRPVPWSGNFRVIERFHPPVFRPPPPIIIPVPPPRPLGPPHAVMPRMPYRGPRPPPRPDMFMYPRLPPFPGPPNAPRRPFW